MKFEPFKGRVLIRKIEPQDSMDGGVFVPAIANNFGKDQGEIVAIPDDLTIKIAVGDKVLYENEEYTLVWEGENVLQVNEKNIISRIIE